MSICADTLTVLLDGIWAGALYFTSDPDPVILPSMLLPLQNYLPTYCSHTFLLSGYNDDCFIFDYDFKNDKFTCFTCIYARGEIQRFYTKNDFSTFFV